MQNRNKGRFTKGKSGNPNGRPSKKAQRKVRRVDDWQNLFTGMGDINFDKRQHNTFAHDTLTDVQSAELWRGEFLAARIIETHPNEMLRAGWSLLTDDDTDARDWIQKRWRELKIDEALWFALAYERAYGGGAILLGANDSKDLSKPLNEDNILSFDYVTHLEPAELQPKSYYADPTAPKYGEPFDYYLRPHTHGLAAEGQNQTLTRRVVHESRIIAFRGIQVSRRLQTANRWGDSVLNRVHAIIRDNGATWASVSTLLQDFAPAILKIIGLADALAQDNDASIEERVRAIQLSQSNIRATIIDAEEEWKREVTPVAGLADLLSAFDGRVAAAADMPQTLLFGRSPAGLNSTGDGDITFFYDRIDALRDTKLRPQMERIIRLLFAANPDRQEPEQWDIEYNPLWQETQKETAETRKTDAETDEIRIATGVLSPEEVARSRYGGAKYGTEIIIDVDAREGVLALEPDPEAKPPEKENGPGDEPEPDGTPDDPIDE